MRRAASPTSPDAIETPQQLTGIRRTTAWADRLMWLNRAVRKCPPGVPKLASAVLIILLATTIVTAEVQATLARPSPRQRIQGTWVLEQVMSRQHLARTRSAIERALAIPGVVGFSVRVPWTLLEPRKGRYDLRVLRRAMRIARPKLLAVRFIAGIHTPAFRRGHSFIYDGSETGGAGAGQRVPLPFSSSGGPNRIFERGWKQLVNRLARWTKQRQLPLLHLAWPGLAWSEIGVVDQMTSQPGYSYRQVRNTHLRLMNHGFRVSSRRMHVEFPWGGPVIGPLYNDLMRRYMSHPRRGRALLSGNGVTGAPQTQPRDPPPPRRAAQMRQPGSYDWSAVYDEVRWRYAEYLEIYTPSFSMGSPADRAELRAEIRAFAQR